MMPPEFCIFFAPPAIKMFFFRKRNHLEQAGNRLFNKVLIEDYLRLIHNSGSIGTVTLRHIGCALVFLAPLESQMWEGGVEMSNRVFVQKLYSHCSLVACNHSDIGEGA